MSFYFDSQDPRKKEFVALRMEQQLFQQLKKEAAESGLDLSATIRRLCSEALK